MQVNFWNQEGRIKFLLIHLFVTILNLFFKKKFLLPVFLLLNFAFSHKFDKYIHIFIFIWICDENYRKGWCRDSPVAYPWKFCPSQHQTVKKPYLRWWFICLGILPCIHYTSPFSKSSMQRCYLKVRREVTTVLPKVSWELLKSSSKRWIWYLFLS